jgi:hypothetical protein
MSPRWGLVGYERFLKKFSKSPICSLLEIKLGASPLALIIRLIYITRYKNPSYDHVEYNCD